MAVASKKRKQAMCQLQRLGKPGQRLRAKNYLLDWLGLSPTVMETCRYSSHHHTMHNMPQGSVTELRFLPHGPHPILSPGCFFYTGLFVETRQGQRKKCNTKIKPCQRKTSCHRNIVPKKMQGSPTSLFLLEDYPQEEG